MRPTPFLFCLFVCLSLLVNNNRAWAQESLGASSIEQDFAKAEAFLKSFKNDSANVILVKLIETLTERKELNSPLGLKVQMRQAEALEKDHQDEIALEKLLHIVEVSEKKEQWDVFTHACLSLARLYEKIGMGNNCLEYLRQAGTAIEQQQLDSIYPRFSIRTSSYHRIYENQDSALFYAKEVLRTAPKFNRFEEEAVGHMLMGMLTRDPSPKARLGHYMAAAKTFKQIEDYTGYGYMIGSVSGWYFKNGNPRLALSYNDSMIVAASKSIEMGHEEHHSLTRAYKYRAEILKTLGQVDSAWHYLKKGYDMELEYIYERNNEKVIEINARYRDEKKEQRIAEQAKLIKYERDRKNLFLGIIAMVLLFASIISYYYLRLRRASQKTKTQALTIIKNNKALSVSLRKQKVLQSEVHHRVKNNLQVIISLLELQMEDIDDPLVHKSFESMSNRIYSMAAIHEILYQQEDMAQVNLFDYTENLCMHFSNFSIAENKPEFNIDIENQFFNIETSMPLGIMLTEMLTNSLKYARVDGKKLQIDISLKKTAEGYCFCYKDNGPGFPNNKLEERESGLGAYLLRSMSRQLNGKMESINEDGASYKIFFKEKNNTSKANSLNT